MKWDIVPSRRRLPVGITQERSPLGWWTDITSTHGNENDASAMISSIAGRSDSTMLYDLPRNTCFPKAHSYIGLFHATRACLFGAVGDNGKREPGNANLIALIRAEMAPPRR